MSSEKTERTLEVVVIFDAQTKKFSYRGDIDDQGRIVVDVQLAWIQLSLATASSPGSSQAVFAEPSPLIWQGGGVPPGLSVWQPQSSAPVTRLVIEDRNPLRPGEPLVEVLPFAILVEFDGEKYHSPDPSIVNVDPPVPGAAAGMRRATAEVAVSC